MLRRKGVTLIELSLVILIIGFLVILARRVLLPSIADITYKNYYEEIQNIEKYIYSLARQNKLIQPFEGMLLYDPNNVTLGSNYHIITSYSNKNIESLCDMYQIDTTIGVHYPDGFKSVDIFVYPENFSNAYSIERSVFTTKVKTNINKIALKFKKQPIINPIAISFNELMLESNCANLQITPTILPTDYQLSNYAVVDPGNYYVYPPWEQPSRTAPAYMKPYKTIEMLFYSSKVSNVLWCAIDNQFVGASTKGVSSYVARYGGPSLESQPVDPNINLLASTGTFSYHISSSDIPDANIPHVPNYYPKEDMSYADYIYASSLIKNKKLSGINIFATPNAVKYNREVPEEDLLFCYDLYSPYKYFNFYNCSTGIPDCPKIGKNLKVSFAPRRLEDPGKPLVIDQYPNKFLDDVYPYSGYGIKGSANFIVYIGYPIPNRNEDEYWDGSLYAIFQDRKLVSFVLW